MNPDEPEDLLPPHSIEAERGVLGCILLDPSILPDTADRLHWTGKGGCAFYDLKHADIFLCFMALAGEGKPIDILSVQQWFSDRKKLGEVGGTQYLSQLPDAVPSAANLPYYAEIVLTKWQQRRIVQSAAHISSMALGWADPIDELTNMAESMMLGATLTRGSTTVRNIKEMARAALDRIEDQQINRGKLEGLSTGFPDLDRLTNGLKNGEMIVIAARPSIGKTSLAMNIAEHVAIDSRIPVGVFSLEMTGESLVQRMIGSRSRCDLRSVLGEREIARTVTSATEIGNAPLFIDDSTGLSILQLRAKARRMAQQDGVKLFVIDYLQLLHSTNRRAGNKQEEVADISNNLKSMAKELNVPVILLAQLNREVEKRGSKPQLSDLRQSGEIEQDADIVGLIYREKTEDDDDGHSSVISTSLLIAKQRNGPTGEVPLTLFKSFTRFESTSRVDPRDVPKPYNDT